MLPEEVVRPVTTVVNELPVEVVEAVPGVVEDVVIVVMVVEGTAAVELV
jgi:hypothetical protein